MLPRAPVKQVITATSEKNLIAMNVLFVTQKNPYQTKSQGGVETSCRLLAEQLALRGHNVFYLTGTADERSRSLARSEHVRICTPMIGSNLRLRFIRRSSRVFWWLSFAYLSWRHRIGLIYCHYDLRILTIALSVRSWLGYPRIVMRMAGLKWYIESIGNKDKLAKYMDVFSRVDSVNFISADLVRLTNDKMTELGVSPAFRHSHTLDIGTSAVPHSKDRRIDAGQAPFQIVMVSRFSNYQKRQDILVRALYHLSSNLPVQLTLVGEGSTRDMIQSLAKDLGVSDRVTFLPFMEQSHLMELLDAHTLLCHSCEFEGLGKIIVEAMMRGLPVLASDVAPLNSYITDGHNGFLVDNSPEAWADRITELLGDRKLLEKVAEQAMDFAEAEWSAAHNVVSYEDYFYKIMGSGPEI